MVLSHVDKSAVESIAGFDLVLEILVFDSPRSFRKLTTPGHFGSIDWTNHFSIQLFISSAVGSYGRDPSRIFDVGFEVLVPRDALEVGLLGDFVL